MATRVITLTASMLRSYKSCPRKFELEYIEQLRPTETPIYFETGTNYHKAIECILTGTNYEAEDDVVAVMAGVFKEHLPWESWNILNGGKTEFEFDIKLSRFAKIAGKIDALTPSGIPIEHKTSSSKLDEKYIRNLEFDDQVSIYLYALSLMRSEPVTECIYTVCQKPTIKHTAKETREEYLERCREWYEMDTESKIGAITVVRTEDELRETENEIKEIVKEIRNRKHWYRNPSNCNLVPCPYSSICKNYDAEVTSGFVKKERGSEELCLESPAF